MSSLGTFRALMSVRSLIAFFTLAAAATAGVIADSAIPLNAQIFDAKPGGWGRVQWHYIYLEAPDWIIADYPTPNTQPNWCFPNANVEKLKAFLVAAGVAQAKVNEWLSDRRAIIKGPEAVTIFPSVADVEGLSAMARSTIYAELATAPQNEFHASPVNILDRSVDEWIGRRKLRPELVEVIKKLTYLRGDVLCFSDVSVLLSYAKDTEEVNDLVKLCTRTRAIMAYLQLSTEDPLQPLTDYWTAGYRRKDVLPMLESISSLPGGGRLGFSHLMPAQPRKLLYTYPSIDMATTGRLPDCHWTTLNFFNYRIQNIFLDLRLATTRVLTGYEKVEPPYKFGDALIFLNKAGDAIHSCTYLCDDLVFTKNGEPLTAPWIISQLADVQRIYTPTGLNGIQAYRRRWDQQQ